MRTAFEIAAAGLAVGGLVQAVRLGFKRDDWLPVRMLLAGAVLTAGFWWAATHVTLGR